jgi:hypothetical protein
MCIYCSADPSDPSLYRKAAHVVAEGVMRNRITLASGVQCDLCNQYFGDQLEPELIRHPAVAWAIQSAKVPGKGGKVRERVGNVVRTTTPAPGFFVETAAPAVRKNSAGETIVTILPLLDPNFQLLRFRRALHLIAFNTLAYKMGAPAARESKYDTLRNYIRRPGREEAWAFAFTYDGAGHEVVVEGHTASELGTITRVQLYTHHFYVDLMNAGRLGEWVAQGLSNAELVGPGDDHPKSPKAGSVLDSKRYRITIEDVPPPVAGPVDDSGRRAS